MSARASRAPAPSSTENRAPDIRAARSKSRMPSAVPSSQCGFGVKSNAGGVPQRLISTLSADDFPAGTLSCGRFGNRSSECVAALLDLGQLRFALADLRAPLLVGGDERVGLRARCLSWRAPPPPTPRSDRASALRSAEYGRRRSSSSALERRELAP